MSKAFAPTSRPNVAASSPAQPAPPKAAPARPPSPPRTPLAELNHYIASQHPHSPHALPASAQGRERPEMKSLRRFKDTWAQMRAEQSLTQAIEKGPANAGPLNSHRLVLRALAQMRDLSPHYLRRFLSHLDALLWLDQINQRSAPTSGKTMRRSSGKK